MFSERDIFWMQHAITLAKRASDQGEVPVGAVLILNDEILAEGSNRPIADQDPTAHAEIIALRRAAQAINNYRLIDTTLYVTLEPCIMCVGAIVHARVKRVVYGAFDLKAGAVSSVFQMGSARQLNHKVDYAGGLLAEQCGQLLSAFFSERRG